MQNNGDLLESERFALCQAAFHLFIPGKNFVTYNKAPFQGNVGIFGTAGKYMDKAVGAAFFVFFEIGAHLKTAAFGKGSLDDATDLDVKPEGWEQV